MRSKVMTWGAAGVSFWLVIGTAHASLEQFEADLQAELAGDDARMAIGQLVEEANGYVAEDVAVTYPNGDLLSIDRYRVDGRYAQPESITLDGIRLTELGFDTPVLTVGELVMRDPSAAVPSLASFETEDSTLNALSLTDMTFRLEGSLGDELAAEFDSQTLAGYLSIDALELEEVSRSAVGLIALQGVSGEFDDLATGISATLALGDMRVEALEGLDQPGEERLEHAELNGFSLTSEQWSVLLDNAWVKGNSYLGEAGFRGAEFDLGGLIDLAPPSERDELQALNRVLTGGTGRLSAEGQSASQWHEPEPGEANGRARLTSEGYLQLDGAGGLEFSMDVPISLPKGATLEQASKNPSLFEAATLYGGNATVAYRDEGLLPRIATEMAAQGRISEEQAISQAWSQAQQLGPLVGPQLTKLMVGMVDIMAGKAQSLTVHVAVPNPFMLNQFILDPMGSSERLTFTFELK
ncbi:MULTISPECIES: hypothetical protein [unclassified Halomonas]|uniref:hypothetical protein n=1 Tax=unclassified Halomonas TaxID=2609666 RepID=UPI001EF705E6|nr:MULTISPECIES: hypothetical protein [unclassified Halomonas]MCG7591920.1 hypothetical protein [Halomonas sp. McD50-5]MCG7617993.1 hypothetical protein [Halomonas sp. McD50-4]